MSTADDLAMAVQTWWGAPVGWGAFSLGELAESFAEAVQEAAYGQQWPALLEAMTGMLFTTWPRDEAAARQQVESWLLGPPELEFPVGIEYRGGAIWHPAVPEWWEPYWYVKPYPFHPRFDEETRIGADPPEIVAPWWRIWQRLVIAWEVGVRFPRRPGGCVAMLGLNPTGCYCHTSFVKWRPWDVGTRLERIWTPDDMPPPEERGIPGVFTDEFKAAMQAWVDDVPHAPASVSDTTNARSGWVLEGFGAGRWAALNTMAERDDA